MLPKIVSPSELRRNLAHFLDLAMHQAVVVTDKESNKVIIDEKEYNRLSALADQFMKEDPEGKYRPKFEKEVLRIARDDEYDDNVSSISDIM
ncbi:MAG: type II toxin-antitoxin system Phd/YefM family antitoxin [Candidatus Peregrinibacteria bacterium]|nr:type II toxin-antitoxin system Phd/YefM family antitoxin [Candidatus Peregrinibacteria bacterium]